MLELTDAQGSTSATIDRDTSELVERTTYLPYGVLDTDYKPERWNTFREDYKFTGKEDDVEVGVTYFGARYYSPWMGRWISADPLAIHALAADLNPYAYVGGAVTGAVDPDGMDLLGDPPPPPTPPPDPTPSDTTTADTGADQTPPPPTTAPSPPTTADALASGAPTGAQTISTGDGTTITYWFNNAYQFMQGFVAGGQASFNPYLAAAGGMAAATSKGPRAFGMAAGLMSGAVIQMVGGATGDAAAVVEEVGSSGTATPVAIPQLVASSAVFANGVKAAIAGAAGLTAFVAQAAKGPPNPYGKAGGPDNQAKVADVVRDIESRGLTAQQEYKVNTPGGEKGARFVDVVARDANGNVVEMHQVGRETLGGNPVAREVRAMDDIEAATGMRPIFHPYN